MKKILFLLILLTAVNLSSCSGKPNSNSDLVPNVEAVEIGSFTEYDLIKELQTMDNDRLSELGYTDNEISEIYSIDFEKIVEDAKEKRYETLKSNGYTDEDIKVIYGDDIDAAARTLSAELICRCEITGLSYSPLMYRTYADVEFAWKWNKCPMITFTDIIGIYVSNRMYIDKSKVFVRYYEDGDWDSYSQTKTYCFEPAGVTSLAECSFDINLFKFPSVQKSEVALEGKALCRWKLDEKLQNIYVVAKYGHSVIPCSPDLAVSGGNLVFTPYIGVSEAGMDLDYIKK